MEIASITAALSGIKNAVDIAKLIKNSLSSLETAELNYKLAELIEALADAKLEIANTKEVVLEKESELRKLKKQIEIDAKIIWHEPYYFLLNDEKEKDGPYCQKCYDSQKMLIRLQSPNKNGFWECKECESQYRDVTFGNNSPVIVPTLMGSARMKR